MRLTQNSRTGAAKRWYSGRGWLAALALATAAAVLPAVVPDGQQGGVRAADASPAAAAPSDFVVSPELPVDVSDGTPEFKFLHDPNRIPESQRVFDRFAWQVFVALNWAGMDDGSPDPAIKTPADDAGEGYRRPRVWETFAETNVLFKAKGAAPEPWAKGQPPRWDATHPMKPRAEVLWMSTKVHNRNARSHASIADENVQAFTGPLVDQNGKWVRYQVRVNRTEYEYIRRNGLFSLEGQEKFLNAGKTVEFPVDGGKVGDETMEYGSIELKLSWKQLAEFKNQAEFDAKKGDDAYLKSIGLERADDGLAVADPEKYTGLFTWFDDPSRFLYRFVRVIRNGGATDTDGVPVPDPMPVPMGVVGMHVSMRTRSSPQWMWATFEHVDNVAVNDLQMVTMPDGSRRRLRPLFNNPDRPADPVNVLPTKNTRPHPVTKEPTDWDEATTTKPVQVHRLLPIPPQTAEMNRIAQAALRKSGSVLQHYELIGIQWPVEPNLPNFPSGQGSAPKSVERKVPGHMVPVYSGNSTMETYFQGGNQMAGGQERDNRPPKPGDDVTLIFATESCVGCHFSAGACLGFNLDTTKVVRDLNTGRYSYPFELKDGRKVPIFGLDGHGGNTGNANFSWLLQMKAQSTGEGVPAGAFEASVAAATQPSAPASVNAPGSDPEQIPRKPK